MRESDADTIRRLFPNATESTKKVNPRIYGNADTVAGLRAESTKPDRRGEGENRSVEGSGPRLEFFITIITFRRKLLDSHDSKAFAVKALSDRVCEWLGFKTDDHPQLHWQFEQVKTSGRQGTLVKIDKFTQQ
jgi:hypothetical protein